MSYSAVLEHELVAVTSSGSTCSCGERNQSWLEHLGAVALVALDAPPSAVAVREDEFRLQRERRAWLRAQKRRLIAEEYRHMTEEWSEIPRWAELAS